jgi:hypothetical protein
MSVYKTNSTCKMSFYHCDMIAYIIWINKSKYLYALIVNGY